MHGLLELDELEDSQLDRLSHEVVLLATLLEIDWDGHYLVDAKLVHPGGHVAGPRLAMPEKNHE